LFVDRTTSRAFLITRGPPASTRRAFPSQSRIGSNRSKKPELQYRKHNHIEAKTPDDRCE
jgi:hypothetical protein